MIASNLDETDWYADTLDLRDLSERRDYLRDLADDPGLGLDGGEQVELSQLDELADQFSDFEEAVQNDPTLIRDSYFKDYAEEMADDIGAIDSQARWPLNHIDWEAAADELKQDYTAYEVAGITWWGHSY